MRSLGGWPVVVMFGVLAGISWIELSCNDPAPFTVPRRDLPLVEAARKRRLQSKRSDTRHCARKKRFYRDRDGDGFGDPRASRLACGPPKGFVANANDCYDQNALARPGQKNYYAKHRGDKSYDYNCDGEQTRRYTVRAYCRAGERGCAYSSGWKGRRVPKCGAPAGFAWKVCRKMVFVRPPPGEPDAGAPATHSAGALVPGARKSQRFACRGGTLPWKKRQLCR